MAAVAVAAAAGPCCSSSCTASFSGRAYASPALHVRITPDERRVTACVYRFGRLGKETFQQQGTGGSGNANQQEAQEQAVNGASWQQSQQRDSSQQQPYTRQSERRYQEAYTDYADYDEDPDDDGQYLYEDQEVYENEGEGGNLFANLGALGQASTMLYNRMRQVLQAVVQAILSGVPFRIPQALVGNGINGLLILVVLWVARALLEVLLYAGIVLSGVFLLARALAFARNVGGGDRDRGFRYRDGGRRQRRRRGHAYQYPDYEEDEEYYDEPAPRRPPPPPPRRRRQAPLAEEPVLRNAWNEPYAWDSPRQQTQNNGTYADDADDRWMDWLR